MRWKSIIIFFVIVVCSSLCDCNNNKSNDYNAQIVPPIVNTNESIKIIKNEIKRNQSSSNNDSSANIAVGSFTTKENPTKQMVTKINKVKNNGNAKEKNVTSSKSILKYQSGKLKALNANTESYDWNGNVLLKHLKK